MNRIRASKHAVLINLDKDTTDKDDSSGTRSLHYPAQSVGNTSSFLSNPGNVNGRMFAQDIGARNVNPAVNSTFANTKSVHARYRKDIKHYAKREKLVIAPKVNHVKEEDDECVEVTDCDITPEAIPRVQRKLTTKEE